MSLFENDKSAERLPVSLITGFLGSGKTTLLNRVLRHEAMRDSAVVINEYGEVSLDHLLVERVDGEVAVLASGCICCTIRSDLEQTLRLDRSENSALDRGIGFHSCFHSSKNFCTVHLLFWSACDSNFSICNYSAYPGEYIDIYVPTI